MKYPALEVRHVDDDVLLAAVDDFSPTALETHDAHVTIFFTSDSHRSAARDEIARRFPAAAVESRDVDDEDWARRSQENLKPVVVGRLVVTPPWHATTNSPVPSPQPPVPSTESGAPEPSPLSVIIAPSMGFGTGHHATTRLCLLALQNLELTGRAVLDVGTGSGVLAIAARLLGAGPVVGIDFDADAIQAARENLDLNLAAADVRLFVGDLRDTTLSPADVVVANLTGALLVQSATQLADLVRPGGTLVVSGLLAHERDGVVAAFAPEAQVAWEAQEDGWVGLTFNRGATIAV